MINKIFKNFQKKSRSSKFKLFLSQLNPDVSTKILDVGSGPGTFLEEKYKQKKNITALDISEEYLKLVKTRYPDVKIIKGNALKLPFKDKSIDIIFSNAVIEHVGNYKKQKIFADEIRRVSKKYFVTTPNKHFPFEPHYRLPFYQWIPKKLQKKFSKFANIGNYKKGEWEDINLLTPKKFKKLFPEAELVRHKILLFPETLICVKKAVFYV